MTKKAKGLQPLGFGKSSKWCADDCQDTVNACQPPAHGTCSNVLFVDGPASGHRHLFELLLLERSAR